jgi:hypothetical protein
MLPITLTKVVYSMYKTTRCYLLSAAASGNEVALCKFPTGGQTHNMRRAHVQLCQLPLFVVCWCTAWTGVALGSWLAQTSSDRLHITEGHSSALRQAPVTVCLCELQVILNWSYFV